MEVIVLSLQIFFARNIDVALGTVRQILSVKGKNGFAAVMAFIEVLIWFFIAREALNTNMNSLLIPISYAGGYASGTFIGGMLAKKFINGIISLNIVFEHFDEKHEQMIRDAGYGLTVIDLEDTHWRKDKKMVYIQTTNKNLKDLLLLVKKIDKKAFIVSSETKFIQNGFIK